MPHLMEWARKHRKSIALAMVVPLGAALTTGCGRSDGAPAEVSGPGVSVIKTPELVGMLQEKRGIPLVLNVWATWCPPCVAEMPELARFHAAHRGKVAFLSVSVDDPAKAEDRVKSFAEAKRLPFHVFVLDETDPDRLGEALGLEWDGAVPVTVLYDARGRIVKTWSGQTTLEALDEAARSVTG